MNWWQIVLLCVFVYFLGGINATVMERERYLIWMANSWEMINRRLWWVYMLKDPTKDITIEQMAEVAQHMSTTIDDYNVVFGRPYLREDLLKSETSFDTDVKNE